VAFGRWLAPSFQLKLTEAYGWCGCSAHKLAVKVACISRLSHSSNLSFSTAQIITGENLDCLRYDVLVPVSGYTEGGWLPLPV